MEAAAAQSELIAPKLAPSSRHLRAQWSEVRVNIHPQARAGVEVKVREWRRLGICEDEGEAGAEQEDAVRVSARAREGG